jgi:hypothetical protein
MIFGTAGGVPRLAWKVRPQRRRPDVSALRTGPDLLRDDLSRSALRLCDAPAGPEAPEATAALAGDAVDPAAAPAGLRFAEVIDGDVIDEAGEVLGRADRGTFARDAEGEEVFTPGPPPSADDFDDLAGLRAEADRVLRLIADDEAHAEATRIKLAGVASNLDREIARARARAESRRRFYAPIFRFLIERQVAAHPKGPRSLLLTYGSIALRRTPATTRVIGDEADLVAWADEHAPELVQEETRRWVPKAEAKRGAMLMVAKGQLPAPPRWIEQTPPGERLVIESATEAGRKATAKSPP